METARVDFDEIQRQLSSVTEGLNATIGAVKQLTSKLCAAKDSSSVGEQWVRTWGETLPKKAAAKMLGVSVTYLNKLIGDGGIAVTPDGRVVVRSAAEWVNSLSAERKTSKQAGLSMGRAEEAAQHRGRQGHRHRNGRVRGSGRGGSGAAEIHRGGVRWKRIFEFTTRSGVYRTPPKRRSTAAG